MNDAFLELVLDSFAQRPGVWGVVALAVSLLGVVVLVAMARGSP